MSQTASEKIRWTTADLQLFPENGNRYEIIDGDLFVTSLFLVATWLNRDIISSPLFPGFSCAIASLFA